MAVTFVLTKQTPNAIAFLVSHDGNAGNVATIDNATLVASLVAGPLFTVPGINFDVNPNSQALGRQHMLGDASALPSQDLTNIPHCACFFAGRNSPGGGNLSWDVDADVDGVSPNRYELNILATPQAASNAVLLIHFQHTIVR